VALQGATLPALSISATRDARTEQIVYWTRIGNHMPMSWPQQRMAVAMDNLRGFIPDAVMVRVSTYGTNQEAALAKIDEFIRTLMASVAPNIRRVFVG
jgi:EpsI family protein